MRSFRDLKVYNRAVDAAMEIFVLTKEFPSDEKFSMVDQMRRSSRSVCANLAEARRKRRYKAAFISKLNDAKSEASETLVWLEFSRKCGYLTDDKVREVNEIYDYVISCLVKMIQYADDWTIREKE